MGEPDSRTQSCSAHCTAVLASTRCSSMEDSLLALLNATGLSEPVLLLLLPGAPVRHHSQLSSSLFLNRSAALSSVLPVTQCSAALVVVRLLELVLTRIFSLVLPPQSSFTDPPAK